jgi:hypothetical protein
VVENIDVFAPARSDYLHLLEWDEVAVPAGMRTRRTSPSVSTSTLCAKCRAVLAVVPAGSSVAIRPLITAPATP